MQKKIYIPVLLLTATIAVLSMSFRENKIKCAAKTMAAFPGGASLNDGAGYSGASWDNSGQYCNSCHSGGAYNPTTTISLLNGTTPVTQYTPGTAYTLKITVTSASGTPKYALTAMCATSTAHTDVNKWGTMPTGFKNNTVNSRHYVEQSSARTASGTSPSSYYTVSIPWTAPVAGTGNITFYVAGMAVNGTGGTGGDSPAPPVNLSVPELNTTPVLLNEFSANLNSSNTTSLTWKTEQEINVAYFEIERSNDSYNWNTVNKVNAKGTAATYNYSDRSAAFQTGQLYYRIKIVETNGNIKYSDINTVTIKRKSIAIASKSATTLGHGMKAEFDFYTDETRAVNIAVTDITGRIISKQTQTFAKGSNSIQVQMPQSDGLYKIIFQSENFKEVFNQIIQ